MRHWLEAGSGELAAFMAETEEPAWRAEQFRCWLHQKRTGDFAAMKNLPETLRLRLAEAGRLRVLDERDSRSSADGLTRKLLFAAPGEALVECVLIIEKRRSRRTACLSCMAGCPLGCRFCATGSGGFVRNLSGGEMVEQAYRLDALAHGTGKSGISHVVFMGMGEPLLNLDAVLAAIDRLADPDGLGLSGRRITLSTAGVPEGVARLAESGRNFRLALSLHAPDQKLREWLMPAACRWPLAEVMAAVDRFAAAASRDVTYEYCLIDGVNSSPAQAGKLARLLSGRRGKVNIIPLNPVPGNEFRPPPPASTHRFQATLKAAGIPCTVRMEKGSEIGAACGQLRAGAEAPVRE
ncbi:MAG: 23S rRNA (adenine(2503)-C(2))-methyltransferase RlmN [Planctomycetota bacterium]|jgi:23S rRNA (adenine2503-C2)-methyltransferase|nr:23S rRNA (adenine(2503)-C(2))-methyltransferase RlmN [Planctomycetota bacterium]